MNDNQLPKPTIPTPPSAPSVSPQSGGVPPVNPQDDKSDIPPPSAFRKLEGPLVGNQPQAAPSAAASSSQQVSSPAPAAPAASVQPSAAAAPPASAPQMPPTTLSALSSMASTRLPQQQVPAPQPMAQQTRTAGPAKVTSTPQQAAPARTQTESAPKADPKFAGAKKPILKYLLFLLGGLVLVAGIAFAAMRFLGGSSTPVQPSPSSPGTGGNTGSGGRQAAPAKQVTLEYWGLWEAPEVLEQVIAEYENQNPGVTIQYTKQSHKDYRQRLQTAIASGNGPDLFRFHASWVPMLKEELLPVPASVISAGDFKSHYYPVAAEQLQHNGQIVGMPLMYDGLALLYNEEVFNAAGESPPKTWAEVRALASKLTVRSGNEITRAGIAMGTANNVEHFSDILALLMLQNGADLSKPNTAFTRDALKFYTNFVLTDNVWSSALPASTVAFARGDVAMIFAPSWKIHEIQAMNPQLKFGVAPVPKLGDEKIAWATYWAEGINSKGNNKEAAAAFLKYLSSEEVVKKLYSSQAQVRSFGELYPQTSLANTLANDPKVAAYLQDAPSAKGWYMSSFTHDNGINDQIIKYYEDAINAMVNDGKTVENVLSTVEQGVRQVLRQYGAAAN